MKKKEHVKVLFKHDAFGGEDIEGAWAKPQGVNYVLDNILFYAKEYSWGDVIKVKNDKGKLFVESLFQESGHSTIRVLFSDSSMVRRIRGELSQMGCSTELSNVDKLISVDIPPDVSYDLVTKFLGEGEEKEEWEYEEACISTHHQK